MADAGANQYTFHLEATSKDGVKERRREQGGGGGGGGGKERKERE